MQRTRQRGDFCSQVAGHLLVAASALLFSALVVHGDPPPIFDWVIRGGGAALDVGRGVAVDRSGNSYITGSIGSTNADFGPVTLTNPPYPNMILAKYDPAGNLVWIRQAVGSAESQGNAVAIDSAGSLYVTGFFRSNAIFGNLAVSGDGSRDVFVVKYDSDGNPLWAASGGGPCDDFPRAIAVDSFGNTYITGSLCGTAAYGDITLTNIGATNTILPRLS